MKRCHSLPLLAMFLSIPACASDTLFEAPDVSEHRGYDYLEPGCADGQILWSEHDICAPVVHDCSNPWQMPLVGGGCAVVGPRACPLQWNLEARDDCPPQELTPCPEGFVETDDRVACVPQFDDDCGEAEIPLIGGGCRKVGPDWVDSEDPTWAAGIPGTEPCGFFQIPSADYGCITVGPRSCPAGWDQNAEEQCTPGDVLPCPDGWKEGAGGLHCEPVYDQCPPGFRAVLGGGCSRVLPLHNECDPGPFVDLLQESDGAVYVLASSPCEKNCGTAEDPCPTIQEGIDIVADDGYVFVGEGEYDEGLIVTKPIHLVGLCAGRVVVTGQIGIVQTGPLKAATLQILNADSVHVTGLSVAGDAAGVVVSNALNVHLDFLELVNNSGAALVVRSNAEVTIADLWIHDVTEGPNPGVPGFGIWLSEGGSAVVEETLVESATGTGVYATDSETSLTMTDSIVRDTRLNSTGFSGHGIRVVEEATGLFQRILVDNNATMGVRISDESQAVLVESVIRNTRPTADQELGVGLRVSDAGVAEVIECLIQSNRAVGLEVRNSGTQVKLVRSTISDTQPEEGGMYGYGAAVGENSSAEFIGSLISGNTNVGVLAIHEETTVSLTGSVISDTHKGSGFTSGLQGTDGAEVHLGQTAISGNEGRGVVIAGAGMTMESSLVAGNRSTAMDLGGKAETTLKNVVVRETQLTEDGLFGIGIMASGGSILSVEDSVVEDCHSVGISLADSGTEAFLEDVAIRRTRMDSNGEFGYGVQLGQDTLLAGTRLLISESELVGVIANEPAARVELADSIIDAGSQDVAFPQPFRIGLGVWGQAQASLSRCLISGSRETALELAESGTEVELIDTVVSGTIPSEPGLHAIAVEAVAGVHVVLKNSVLEWNHGTGILSEDPSTHVVVTATVVRNTLPVGKTGKESGIQVGQTSTLTMTDSLLEANTRLGLGVLHEGSSAHLTRTVIRGTKAGGQYNIGYGIHVGMGADLTLTGALIDQNRSMGLNVFHSGSTASIVGTLVRGTVPDDSGWHGEGVASVFGGKATVAWSLIRGNSTAGVMAYETGMQAGEEVGSEVSLSNVTVSETNGGGGPAAGEGPQTYGDGVFSDTACTVAINRSIFRDNRRTGLFFYESSGSLEDVLVTGNSSYGLAMRDCAERVSYLPDHTFFFGNAIDLPEGMQKDVEANPGGLPIPPPPTVVTVE